MAPPRDKRNEDVSLNMDCDGERLTKNSSYSDVSVRF